MEKANMSESNTKSSRMVGYLAAAVALLAVAFIVLIACATYMIENQDCDESSTEVQTPAMAQQPEACDEFHYEGHLGNTTYSEHTTVCPNTKTEFGVVRDKNTGFVMNTFFMDYIQEVGVVYLAKSHTCLLSNDLEADSFEQDLDDYRSERYGQGPFVYSVGDAVNALEDIPADMRGFCSPRNTFRWLKHAPEEHDDDHHRNKRHGIHLCCCFFIYGGSLAVSWICGYFTGTCTLGAACFAGVYGHWDTCSTSGSVMFDECIRAYNFYG